MSMRYRFTKRIQLIAALINNGSFGEKNKLYLNVTNASLPRNLCGSKMLPFSGIPGS